MKKVMVFVAVLTMVAFVFGAMAVAQKTTITPAKPAPAPKMEKFRGTIVKVDAMAKTFDVKGKVTIKGKEEEKVMTFATDDKTKITMGKEVKTFADLKAGMNVFVEYKKLTDKNLALTVKITGGTRSPRPVHP
jgi:hypothetical protein